MVEHTIDNGKVESSNLSLVSKKIDVLSILTIMYLIGCAVENQFSFLNPVSPVMELIINFHNYVMIYIVLIMILVSYILISIILTFSSSRRLIAHKYLIHGTMLEIIWTILPAFILMALALPSFQLLYFMDEIVDPGLTIKAIGSQWYWSYSIDDYHPAKINFSSYMVPDSDLKLGDFRLLEVDNKLIVPVGVNIRVIVTATDVLHCWSIPSLGVKIDAVPCRLNQTSFVSILEGKFYGQCSEICGANHAFMPICIQAVSFSDYIAWIKSRI